MQQQIPVSREGDEKDSLIGKPSVITIRKTRERVDSKRAAESDSKRGSLREAAQ